MNSTDVIAAQLDFYRRNMAGCSFAAFAAVDPRKYGWSQKVITQNSASIDAAVEESIASAETTMVSLIFADICTFERLISLVNTLQTCSYIFLEQNVVFDGFHCLGFRVKVGSVISWISGFGPFDLFPATRRSKFTEIAFRVKPRPQYTRVMKPAPDNVIHLADLDTLGMTEATFKEKWYGSLERTAQLLGHKPDLKSAAKTTFSIPTTLTESLTEAWSKPSS